jgi:hypothetical protein
MTLNPYLVSSLLLYGISTLLLYGISTLLQNTEKLIAKQWAESLFKG